MLVRSDPQGEPVAAVSLLLLAPAWDVALIFKLSVDTGLSVITSEGVSIVIKVL